MRGLLFYLLLGIGPGFGQTYTYGSVRNLQGTGAPTASWCAADLTGRQYYQTDGGLGCKIWLCAGGAWEQQCSSGSSGIPSGSILLIASGSCPAGFTEETTLNGKTLLGTLEANKDVGGTGGSDTITPGGSVSAPSFMGAPLGTHSHGVGTYSASVPTFTGSALATHQHGAGTYVPSAHSGTAIGDHATLTHTGTAVDAHTVGAKAGTSGGSVSFTAPVTHTVTQPSQHAAQIHSVTQPSAHTMAGSSEAISAGTPAGTISSPTLTGNSESVSAGTPSGIVSAPSFEGQEFDNRPSYRKVIFCRKQ